MLLKSLLLIGGIPPIRLCHRKKRVTKQNGARKLFLSNYVIDRNLSKDSVLNCILLLEHLSAWIGYILCIDLLGIFYCVLDNYPYFVISSWLFSKVYRGMYSLEKMVDSRYHFISLS